jgi:pyruvate formate lyase activating enzyme
MKEVELYVPLEGGKVKCTACARNCQLGDGQIGLCGIRQNIGGKLQLLSYGKLFTGHIDPIEKKPVTHYHPGTKIFSVATSGCNWLCHPAGSKILLANGSSKNVEDMAVGDVLWSYDLDANMKIRPNVVTHTGSREAEVWKIRYGSNPDNVLLLTGEHPVLTPSGWKPAGMLRAGDSLMKVWYQNTQAWKEKRAATIKGSTFVCARCSEKIVGLDNWNKHRGECYLKGYVRPIEVIAAYRKRMTEKNPMRDPEVARRALATSKARFLVDPTHGWYENRERLRTWLHQHPSKSQLFLYRLLDELSVPYEKEYRIRTSGKIPGSRMSYVADAAFPEIMLDIEIDGWWHYNNDEVKGEDRIRDEALRAEGWEVLRIGGSYVYAHPDEVKILISQRLAPPLMVNKRQWLEITKVQRTGRIEKVYGIETIPNHNYVADQVICHNCRYCQNYDISQRRKVEGIDLEPREVPGLALAQGCQGIAYTYNEPTIFVEYARDIGLEAHIKGLFNIFVSNGFGTPETVRVMSQFLDCITVDFKGSGETSFVRKYIGIPSADPIFETLREIKQKTKIHVEITDLIVPSVGDDLASARKLSRWVGDNLGPQTPIHFLRFHPDYKMMEFPPTPVKTLEAHHKVAKEEGLQYVYLGNVPGHPLEHTYCHGCGKIVVNRYGFDITEWNLTKGNKCKFCGTQIPIEGDLASTVSELRYLPAYF